MPETNYDALLYLSFGGPEQPDDVIPFLENVLRGRNVPRERMLEVAEHYYHFGGKSPINDQNRAVLAALRQLLETEGPNLPVYWGNRNWHPLLPDTLQQMTRDGVQRALVFTTSAYSSYSGCRQYRENVADAQQQITSAPAPECHKLRVFFNHPGFIGPMIEHTQQALAEVPEERRAAAKLVFTAHSVPMAMASTSQYVPQLREASRLVAEGVSHTEWKLVYQSRSGPPTQPWLEPDVLDHLRGLPAGSDVVLVPIGFVSDHLEVLYDLDTEARALAEQIGIHLVRARTVGAHPQYIAMIRELIQERLHENVERRALGRMGPHHDVCPENCCPAPPRRPTP